MRRLITSIIISLITSTSVFCQISWVTSLEDDTIQGTLRYAINHAITGTEIRFADSLLANGSDTLALDSTIFITTPISLRGHMRNGDTLFVSGDSAVKIFDIDIAASAANADLKLDSLAIIEGFSTIGGAMELHFIGRTEISNCYFKNNSSIYGGGVIDSDILGSNFLAHLQFENNTLVENAGPYLIRFKDIQQIRMKNIHIRNNNCNRALSAYANNKLIATKFYVNNNYKVNPFGANMLLTLSADTLLTDSLFVINNTEAGAFSFGGYWQHHKNLHAINNSQPYGAGALSLYWFYTSGNPPLFENCVFRNNTAGDAGAIRATALTMKNSIIRGNTTTRSIYGYGAIKCESSAHLPLSFIDCVIDSNTTTQGLGGAIYGSTKHLYLERVSIYQNDGGTKGGAVTLTNCDSVTIMNSYIGDNTADENAGIYLSINSIANIKNTTICRNTAQVGTGGLDSRGSIVLSSNLILNNTPVNFGTSNSIPTFVSNGYNMIAQSLSSADFQRTDIINPPAAAKVMSSLTYNGGSGLTRRPLAGNLAINLGNPSDTSMPYNSHVHGGRRDIGAVESNDSTLRSFTSLQICDSLFFDGNWIANTGFYIDSAKSVQNTDSIAIVKIDSINHSVKVVDVRQSCNSILWIDGHTYTSDNNTASVIFAAQNGCDSTVTLDFTKIKLDTGLTVTGSNIELNLKTASTQWYTCDSALQLIPGATSPIFKPSSSGRYLAILEKDGCVDTTSCVKFFRDIGLLENNADFGIQVFPNPTSDIISITWPERNNPHFVRIYKMDGQLVKEVILEQNLTKSELNLEKLPNGPYLLTVEGINKAIWKTVVLVGK